MIKIKVKDVCVELPENLNVEILDDKIVISHRAYVWTYPFYTPPYVDPKPVIHWEYIGPTCTSEVSNNVIE